MALVTEIPLPLPLIISLCHYTIEMQALKAFWEKNK